MAKYIYSKYNAVYVPTTYKLRWVSEGNIHGWSNICGILNFNTSTGKFTTSNCGGSIDSSKDGNPIGHTVYQINTDGKLYKFEKFRTSNNGYYCHAGSAAVDVAAYYYKGSTSYDDVSAEDGTYPVDGRHTDGFWYVRGGLAFPELKMIMDASLKTSEKGWTRINGQLREIDKIWTKTDGVLKEV